MFEQHIVGEWGSGGVCSQSLWQEEQCSCPERNTIIYWWNEGGNWKRQDITLWRII